MVQRVWPSATGWVSEPETPPFFHGTPLPPLEQDRGRVWCQMIPVSVEGINCKRPIPICRLFFKIDLLDIATLCLTDFIDWRSDPFTHWLVFSTQLVNCCPHGRRNYTCVLLPLYLLSDLLPPHPKLNVMLIQTVCVWGGRGGGWIVLCRPYSAGILHSVSDQMQNLPNYFTTPNKMTSENDIKGLVSLKFLRPCLWA
jgi:hypothetical protein